MSKTQHIKAARLTAIRNKLGVSQEQMGELLGMSLMSVNRWEGGRTRPTGPTRDLYLAISAAIRAGNSAGVIRKMADGKRGTFLYSLFRMAYSHGKLQGAAGLGRC